MRPKRVKRPQLVWLGVPFVLFLGVLPVVNRIEPRVGGVPFLFVWLLGATLVTPLAVWLTRRGDLRDPGRYGVDGGEADRRDAGGSGAGRGGERA
ncbi:MULTISPECIES: DUF3311 domain-containing protein [unclassified Streptomyces]|uniref:DUF3311 domain-containing protein n=1 Tax=unclassified Streptomyces TaxID=2593676 RepID=UPI003668AAB6